MVLAARPGCHWKHLAGRSRRRKQAGYVGVTMKQMTAAQRAEVAAGPDSGASQTTPQLAGHVEGLAARVAPPGICVLRAGDQRAAEAVRELRLAVGELRAAAAAAERRIDRLMVIRRRQLAAARLCPDGS